MTMMVYVLIVLEAGKPTGEQFFFRELTSCLEVSNALNSQRIGFPLGGRNRFFESYCRVREIPTGDAGTKIQFRDPTQPQ